MKYLIFLLLSLAACLSYSEPMKYRNDIEPKQYNEILKSLLKLSTRIDYDFNQDSFDFYIKESLYVTGFTLTRAQANSLISAIDKYKEWSLKASSKKVTLEKEIAKIETLSNFWQIGKGDWSSSNSSEFSLMFFSQSEEVHQLVMVFPKLTDSYNSYSSHKPDNIYFDYSEAIKLRDALTLKSIAKFLIESKKQAGIDAEFN